MSLESLRFMLGGAINSKPSAQAPIVVRHTAEVVVNDDAGNIPSPIIDGVRVSPKATVGHPIKLINLGGGANNNTTGTRTQIVATTDPIVMNATTNVIEFKNTRAGVTTATIPARGDHIRIFWEEVLDGDQDPETAVEVTISPDTFPGTYRVVGDTYMRSEKTGKDEPFQFVINKAKVQSNVTFTLQAEGDPTTFEMTLNVLRSNDSGENEMMKLVRYNISGGTSASTGDDIGDLTTGS